MPVRTLVTVAKSPGLNPGAGASVAKDHRAQCPLTRPQHLQRVICPMCLKVGTRNVEACRNIRLINRRLPIQQARVWCGGKCEKKSRRSSGQSTSASRFVRWRQGAPQQPKSRLQALNRKARLIVVSFNARCASANAICALGQQAARPDPTRASVWVTTLTSRQNALRRLMPQALLSLSPSRSRHPVHPNAWRSKGTEAQGPGCSSAAAKFVPPQGQSTVGITPLCSALRTALCAVRLAAKASIDQTDETCPATTRRPTSNSGASSDHAPPDGGAQLKWSPGGFARPKALHR